MPRSLKLKLAISTAVLVVTLLLLIVAIHRVTRHINITLVGVAEEYQEYLILERLNGNITKIRGNLASKQPDLAAIALELNNAARHLSDFAAYQPTHKTYDQPHQAHESALAGQLAQSIDAAIAALQQTNPQTRSPDDSLPLIDSITQVLSQTDQIMLQSDAVIRTRQQAAQTKLHTLVWGITLTTTVIGLAGIAIALLQYRGVIRPLTQLHQAVKLAAQKNLSQKIPAAGSTEFVELANDFNHMTAELHNLYRELENRVAAKSKQLARSERLASVGFLAAGVAHEINNPLTTICGYSEILIKQLAKHPLPPAASEWTDQLRIIREESLRCKHIIQKLLALTPSSQPTRTPTDLAAVARDVRDIIAGNTKYNHQRLELHFDPHSHWTAPANEAEIKQVLLNLVTNALDAVDPATGLVSITASRDNTHLQISVTDNGSGMTPQTLEKAFEPFFSLKSRDGSRGTGLGLSISHAIISDHAGSLHAQSPGPGKGSSFTFRLPLAQPSDHTNGERRHQSPGI